METKELRTLVVNFLTEKSANADTSQSTTVLLKRAVKLGFTEPENSEPKEEPKEELTEEPKEELKEEPKEEPKKTRKPREKKVVEPVVKDEPILAKLEPAFRPDPIPEKQPEKSDNSIYWIIAIAALGIAIIIFLKKYNNANQSE
jgi:hypothetical protein